MKRTAAKVPPRLLRLIRRTKRQMLHIAGICSQADLANVAAVLVKLVEEWEQKCPLPPAPTRGRPPKKASDASER